MYRQFIDGEDHSNVVIDIDEVAAVKINEGGRADVYLRFGVSFAVTHATGRAIAESALQGVIDVAAEE